MTWQAMKIPLPGSWPSQSTSNHSKAQSLLCSGTLTPRLPQSRHMHVLSLRCELSSTQTAFSAPAAWQLLRIPSSPTNCTSRAPRSSRKHERFCRNVKLCATASAPPTEDLEQEIDSAQPSTSGKNRSHDTDYVVIGSGIGGERNKSLCQDMACRILSSGITPSRILSTSGEALNDCRTLLRCSVGEVRL